MAKKKICQVLDDYLIPDLTNIVIHYLSCSKCKSYNNGWKKCICGDYMCNCLPRTKCDRCEKIICQRCNDLKMCCNRINVLCGYCHSYIFDKFICIFGNCRETICSKCFHKFGGLCRGHKLLKKYEPNNIEFKGVIGL